MDKHLIRIPHNDVLRLELGVFGLRTDANCCLINNH